MSLYLRRRTGFTLIELLVVIAIIALLIGILLPALGKARMSAWKVVSISNNRQIMLGAEQYRNDNDGFPAYPPTKMSAGRLSAICTWSYGGKDTGENWKVGGKANAPIFDIAGGARPVNDYLYPDTVWPEPLQRNEDPDNFKPGKPQEPRQQIELEVFRSPGDKVSRQTRWPRPEYEVSSYDDVGTSYHTQLRWHDVLRSLPRYNGDWTRAYNEGMRRFRMAGVYDPSKFVFIFDQTADVVTADQDDPRYPDEYKGVGIEGEFGEMNKAVMAFFDSHVEYKQLEVGKANTNEYKLYFELRGDNP